MDKKVLYALLGGVALVGAAFAFHMIDKSSEESELDSDLK